MNHTLTDFLIQPGPISEWVSLSAGVATVVVIYFLFRQMKQTESAIKLAHIPHLIMTGQLTQTGIQLAFQNVGKTTALNINYKIKETTSGESDSGQINSIPSNERHRVRIMIIPNSRFHVTGTFSDATGNIHDFVQDFVPQLVLRSHMSMMVRISTDLIHGKSSGTIYGELRRYKYSESN